MIGTILIGGYRCAAKAYRLNPNVGGLFLAYIVVSAVYSITEAGFRMMDPMWIFLLIAVVASTAVTNGVWEPSSRKALRLTKHPATLPSPKDGAAIERGSIYANRPSTHAAKFAR